MAKTGDNRRGEIIDTMLAMAAEEGADRVTTRGLARRRGVTEPALYRHFPGGKAEMWRALAATVGERMQAGWRAALARRDRTAPERLRGLIHAQLHTIATIPALPAILFSRTLHRDNAALRAGVNEVAGRFHAHIEQILIDGQRNGELRSDSEPEDAAWLLISVVQGTAIRWSLADRAFDLEERGGGVLEVALTGLLPTPSPEAADS